jgi:hypothetical protein
MPFACLFRMKAKDGDDLLIVGVVTAQGARHRNRPALCAYLSLEIAIVSLYTLSLFALGWFIFYLVGRQHININ